MLVATIAKPTLKAALAEMEQARPYADAFEIRFDYFNEEIDVGRLKVAAKLPLIFTFRKEGQGGKKKISEKKRLEKIEELLSFKPDYLDLETDTDPSFVEGAKGKTQVIGSYHNFEETPADLRGLIQGQFDVYKIALQANSTLDMLRLMAFAKDACVPLSAVSMGEFGKPSRVLGPIVGNVFDYAGIEEDLELHRYSLKTLVEVFQYRKLNRNTEIYALLGDPVAHSKADLYHNEQLKDRNAVYVKLRLRAHELGPFFQMLPKFPFKGFSVTIPLKEAILPYLDAIDPKAKKIGAVNTLRIDQGKVFATNTDAPGALKAIEKHCKVKGKRVAILGAGGSARAIAYEALQRGAAVLIFNRTLKRAVTLAEEFGCEGRALSELPLYPYDLLINTIPPHDGPVPPLLPNRAVMDIITRPSSLLEAAQKLGCPCIFGSEMWEEQAILQQRFWR